MTKKIIGWLHLWLGIASGLVVLVVALTGSLLVFEEELDPLFHPSFFYVEAPAAGEKAVSMDVLAGQVQERYKGYRLRRILIEQAANRSVIFIIEKGKHNVLAVAVNQYTGHIIQAVNEDRRFFRVVLQLHRFLCMGPVGKTITGISCIIFLVMILTGLVLWWPKRNSRKQRMRVKWDASWKRLNWDLHAVLGFYVHIVIFLIALTGLTWSYKWANNLIFYAFDGKPMEKMTPPQAAPVAAKNAAYLDRALAITDSILTYNGPIDIRFLEKKDQAFTVIKQNTAAAVSNVASSLFFQKGSGQLLKTRLYEAESRGMKARRLVYPIHTGSLYGWPTKILALIASLIAASLPVTGLCIWLNRKKKASKTIKSKPQQPIRSGKIPYLSPQGYHEQNV